MPPSHAELISWHAGARKVKEDLSAGTQGISREPSRSTSLLTEIATYVNTESEMRAEIDACGGTSSRLEYSYSMGWSRHELHPCVRSWSKLVTTRDEFRLEGLIEAFCKDEMVYRRNWKKNIRRKGV